MLLQSQVCGVWRGGGGMLLRSQVCGCGGGAGACSYGARFVGVEGGRGHDLTEPGGVLCLWAVRGARGACSRQVGVGVAWVGGLVRRGAYLSPPAAAMLPQLPPCSTTVILTAPPHRVLTAPPPPPPPPTHAVVGAMYPWVTACSYSSTTPTCWSAQVGVCADGSVGCGGGSPPDHRSFS